MRLRFEPGKQTEFLQQLKKKKKLGTWKALSRMLGVNYRTFNHYLKERCLLPEKIWNAAQASGMSVGRFKVERLNDHWGVGVGGKKRVETIRRRNPNHWKMMGSKGGMNRTKNLPLKLRLEISRRGGINARDKGVGIHDPRFGENRFLGPFGIKYRSGTEVGVARMLEAKGVKFVYDKPFVFGNRRILIDFYLPKHDLAIEIEGFGYDEYLQRNLGRYRLLEQTCLPVHVFTRHVTKTTKAFEGLRFVSVLSMKELSNFVDTLPLLPSTDTPHLERDSVGRRAARAEAGA